MTTLTITLDDSPEAQLIITLLKQVEAVKSVQESPLSEASPFAQEKELLRPQEISRDWNKRNQAYWEELRTTPDWTNTEDLYQP